MKLIRLYANKPQFKDIKFNETGISIIYAEKTEEQEREKSYNGVGKSLSLKIIDFCLGSRDSTLDILEGWIFFLDFSIGERAYTVARSTGENKNKLTLNGEEISNERYKDFLLAQVTEVDSRVKNFTFRALLPRFLKSRAEDYAKEIPIIGRESVMQSQVTTAYLFDLDYEAAATKIENREKYYALKTSTDAVKKSEIMKREFKSAAEIDSKVINLEVKKEGIEKKLDSFKLAENYDDIVMEYENLRSFSDELVNELVIKGKIKARVESDMNLKSEITADEVNSFYEEVGLLFSDSIKRSVKQVSDFHKIITQNRQIRLVEQNDILCKQIKELEEEIQKVQAKIDTVYSKLSKSISFKEYEALMEELVEIRTEIGRYQNKSEILRSHETEMSKIETDMQAENNKAIEFLNEKIRWIQSIQKRFVEYSKAIYPNANAGLEIRVNQSLKNKMRYDFIQSIESDQAGGISKAKILIFDLLLMTIGKHKMEFICHDNYIFLEMDKRQCASALKLIDDQCKKYDFQYIFTISYDDFAAIKENLNNDEMDLLGEDKIVLRLHDRGDEGKLLGKTYIFENEKKASKKK